MKQKIYLVSSLILGILGTIGGWYMFLMMFDLVPFPDYSILSLVLMLCGLGVILSAQLLGGPMIIWDVYKSYRGEDTVTEKSQSLDKEMLRALKEMKKETKDSTEVDSQARGEEWEEMREGYNDR